MKKYSKIIAPVLILALIFGGCAIYASDYYRTDGEALLRYTEGCDPSVQMQIEISRDMIITRAESPVAGLVFYPGGKVEFSAYLPLMLRLAEYGVSSVILKMPLNLAVLDVNAAQGTKELLPEVDRWYIGGHSLGGSMAASYLAKAGGYEGLILLASYSTADVSGYATLSIFGSEDGVMNREKYEQYRTNLPTSLTEVVIEGGNHAYFGIYGEQEGDGKATITASAQITLTAELIYNFIK